MFEKLGKKLFESLGDSRSNDSTHKSYFNDAWKDLAAFYKVSDLLPYDAYSSKNQLFYNQTSVGFVIETATLVGASEEMQKEVSNLFALSLPEESSMQVMLWAGPKIGDFLNSYVDARANDHPNSEILQTF